MRALVLLALAGFLAQLVDGSLGMAYGVTSTTLLLLIGTNRLPGLRSTWRRSAPRSRQVSPTGGSVTLTAVVGRICAGRSGLATPSSSLSTETAKPVMSRSCWSWCTSSSALPPGGVHPRPQQACTLRFLVLLGLFGDRRRDRRRRLGRWARLPCSPAGVSSPAKSSAPSTPASSSSPSLPAPDLVGLGSAGGTWATVALLTAVSSRLPSPRGSSGLPPRVLGSAVGG